MKQLAGQEQDNSIQNLQRGEKVAIPWEIVIFTAVSIMTTRLIFFLIYAVKFQNTDFSGFLGHVDIWDAGWYREIAETGYPETAAGTSSWAFFPLFPITVRMISMLTGMDVDHAGFLASNICYFIACLYSYHYILTTRRNEEEGWYYIALMTWGICGFYDGILYTEAMYLMFLTMSFCYLKDRQFIRMGVCGALMSATRNTGVFFVFVILSDQIHEWRLQRKRDPQFAVGLLPYLLSQGKLVLGTMMVPAGLFAYMQYLYLHTGDGFAFVHIQKAFMKDTRAGIVNVWLRVFRLYRGQVWVYAYLAALILILILILLNRRNDERIWGVLNWLIPQQRGLGSMQRYFHTCVVVELTFCDFCMKWKRWVRILILILLFLANCVTMNMWLDGNGWLV